MVSIALVEGGSEYELDEDIVASELADNIAQDGTKLQNSADLHSADLQNIELSQALQQDGLPEADAQQLDD